MTVEKKVTVCMFPISRIHEQKIKRQATSQKNVFVTNMVEIKLISLMFKELL